MTFNTQEESLSIIFTKGIKTYLTVIITSHINATQKSIFSINGASAHTMYFKITKATTMIAAMVARMIIAGINIPMISSLWLLNEHTTQGIKLFAFIRKDKFLTSFGGKRSKTISFITERNKG